MQILANTIKFNWIKKFNVLVFVTENKNYNIIFYFELKSFKFKIETIFLKFKIGQVSLTDEM